jgi:hypothetical protein
MAEKAKREVFMRRYVLIAAVIALVAGLAPVAVAEDERQERGSIRISKDSQFTKANGVRSGSGTASDPYVISGWDVSSLEIHDTAAHVLIHDNTVRNQLTLNWIGPGVRVVDNIVGDLRVNENVERTGEPTAGYFGHNQFGIVGQLRHFDGIFERNVVDPQARFFDFDALPFFSGGPVVNFDGFNGAFFRFNKIYGPVRAQLHGHHHSTGYGEHSHHHSSSMEDMDHTNRWHELWITDNVIYSDDEYALMYTDVAHSANDRTANSEENEELNKPHVHHTRVHLNRNELIGSGLVVDVFNANDQRHTGTEPGLVELRDNDIMIAVPETTEQLDFRYAGIEVDSAKDVKLLVIGNKVVGEASEDEQQQIPFFSEETAGIRLWNVSKGLVYAFDNVVVNRYFGIQAAQFKDVTWYVDGLQTKNVTEAVAYDESSGAPKDRP